MILVREADCYDYDPHRDIITSDDIGNDVATPLAWEQDYTYRPDPEVVRYARLEGLRDAMVEEMGVLVRNGDVQGINAKMKEIAEVEREIMGF